MVLLLTLSCPFFRDDEDNRWWPFFVVKIKLVITLAILLIEEIQKSGNLFCLHYSMYVKKHQYYLPRASPSSLCDR